MTGDVSHESPAIRVSGDRDLRYWQLWLEHTREVQRQRHAFVIKVIITITGCVIALAGLGIVFVGLATAEDATTILGATLAAGGVGGGAAAGLALSRDDRRKRPSHERADHARASDASATEKLLRRVTNPTTAIGAVVIGVTIILLAAVIIRLFPGVFGPPTSVSTSPPAGTRSAPPRLSATPTPQPITYVETAGGAAATWTDPLDAGGGEGPEMVAQDRIQVSCRLLGFAVSDGNRWWYRIASSPWNEGFYVTADAFYNNGRTSGTLHGSLFFDARVPLC